MVYPSRTPNGERFCELLILCVILTCCASGIAFGADTTPDAFRFDDQREVATGRKITSNAVTVTGIDGPADLTLTGATSRGYSINGGAFVSGEGTVNSGDVVLLRLTSASTANTRVTARLSIGGVGDTWIVETGDLDTTPEPVTFQTRRDVVVNATATSLGKVISEINGPTPISVSGAPGSAYSINGGSFVTVAGTVSNGDRVRVRHKASPQLLTRSTTFLRIGSVRNSFASVTRDTRTYKSGSSIFLERRVGDDIQRVGMRLDWGSSIVEASVNGINFVNAYDDGREVQLAVYDGRDAYPYCGSCEEPYAGWGWNPVQGGDIWNHGSPTLEHRLSPNSIYIRTIPNHWWPNNRGGGQDMAVTSDVQFEQWLTPVTGKPHAFKVRSRITHLGNDRHRAAGHEVPAVYCNLGYDTFMTYAGSAPWTNDSISSKTLPHIDSGNHGVSAATERWGACVDSTGVGMTIYVPQAYPHVAGFHVPDDPVYPGSGTNYFHLQTSFDIPPGAVIDSDFYILLGDVDDARGEIYSLRDVPTPDFCDPDATFDAPTEGELVSGTIPIYGWAWDNDASHGGYVASVEVFVDGISVGLADIHQPRPDVAEAVPGTPEDTGYVLEFDTTALLNGPHSIRVAFADFEGNKTNITHQVTVAN